jgi:hypothetical protein
MGVNNDKNDCDKKINNTLQIYLVSKQTSTAGEVTSFEMLLGTLKK